MVNGVITDKKDIKRYMIENGINEEGVDEIVEF
jgi:hypothetical protein